MQIIPIIEYREGVTVSEGPWHVLRKVRNVLRPDGKYGTAEVTGEADTWFSVPARMSIDGRKVRGFLMVVHFGYNVLSEDTPDYTAEMLNAQRNNGWNLSVWTFTPRRNAA